MVDSPCAGSYLACELDCNPAWDLADTLRARGPATTLRDLAHSSPLPIEPVDTGIGRGSLPIKAAICFCVREAIQNVAKHA
jgi:hypothetical protein